MHNYFLIGLFSVVTMLAVIALARERRLRLALERLLKRLLQAWRDHE